MTADIAQRAVLDEDVYVRRSARPDNNIPQISYFQIWNVILWADGKYRHRKFLPEKEVWGKRHTLSPIDPVR